MNVAEYLAEFGPENPAPDYRLLRRGATLRSLPDTAPLLPELKGDIALCDGRIVARWDSYSPHGGIARHYAELPAGADLDFRPRPGRFKLPEVNGKSSPAFIPGTPDFSLTHGAVTIDPAAEIHDAIERTHPRGWLDVDLTDPHDEERTKFVEAFPGLAAELGVSAPLGPQRLFSPGRVRRSPVVPPGLEVDWKLYVELHSTGQWGVYSGHDPGFEPTTAQAWAAGLERVSIQNHLSVRAGAGPIRSRWRLDDDAQALVPRWNGQRRIGHVEILTNLAGPATETIMSLALEVAAG